MGPPPPRLPDRPVPRRLVPHPPLRGPARLHRRAGAHAAHHRGCPAPPRHPGRAPAPARAVARPTTSSICLPPTRSRRTSSPRASRSTSPRARPLRRPIRTTTDGSRPMAFAKLMLIGNLGRDPEMRYTPSGRPVTEFSVAVSHRGQGRHVRRMGRPGNRLVSRHDLGRPRRARRRAAPQGQPRLRRGSLPDPRVRDAGWPEADRPRGDRRQRDLARPPRSRRGEGAPAFPAEGARPARVRRVADPARHRATSRAELRRPRRPALLGGRTPIRPTTRHPTRRPVRR